MSFFTLNSYKEILRYAISEKKTEGGSVRMTALAEACHIQKTYLSRVLNHDAHLNSDQIFLAGQYLRLTKREMRFTTLLHELERSEVAERKKILRLEIDSFRKKALDSENYLKTEMLRAKYPELIRYHLNPNLQLVHIFMTIPKFAKNTNLIEEKLNIPRKELSILLEDLLQMGIVSKQGGEWKVEKESLHLSAQSEIYPFYRTLLRTKSISKIQDSSNSSDFTFSVVFSSDEKTRNKIQENFMNFLKSSEAMINKAPPQEVYQLNFDLIGWSRV